MNPIRMMFTSARSCYFPIYSSFYFYFDNRVVSPHRSQKDSELTRSTTFLISRDPTGMQFSKGSVSNGVATGRNIDAPIGPP